MLPSWSFLLLAFFPIEFACFRSIATEDALFGLPEHFLNGDFGSKTALSDDNHVVEVFVTDNSTIWFRIGEMNGLIITWSNATSLEENGYNVGVASNSKGVVIMFEFENGLFYKTGHRQNQTISWNKAIKFDNRGTEPSIGLTAFGTVLEMHQVDNQIFWSQGTMTDPNRILFYEVNIHANGSNVQLSVNCRGEVVEVHIESYKVWHTSGKVDNNVTQWGTTELLDSGIEASVALNNLGQVFVVIRKNDREIRSYTGLFNPANLTVDWDSKKERKLPFHEAKNLYIASNNNSVILTSKGTIVTSLIRDRRRWMELTAGVQDKPLWRLTLPGSHDAGAYSLSDFRVREGCKKVPDFIPGFITKAYAETQNENMFEQLENGVRYFDIRPYYWPRSEEGTNDFHIYHDNIGSRISRVLYLVKTFMESVSKELVILHFSHFCSLNFDEESGAYLHERLASQIRSILKEYVLNFDSKDFSPWSTPIKDMLKFGPKVLIIYETDFPTDNAKSVFGFLRHNPIFDVYSNTDDLTAMQNDQLWKLHQSRANETHLFLLSYTMTWQTSTFSNQNNVETLHDLTKNASRTLASFVDANDADQINIVYVDFCSEARVTDVSIYANEKNFKNRLI